MPIKYVKKDDREQTYYHVFNRGANQAEVFQRKEDYWIFRAFAKQARKKVAGLITIDSFALLPNHFHFLVFQKKSGAISHFMKSLGVRFGLYFGETRDHKGHVFESTYKAKILLSRKDVLRTRAYILNNPLELGHVHWPHAGRKL